MYKGIWNYGDRPLIDRVAIERIVVKKPKHTLWQRVVRRVFQGPWKRDV